MFTFNLRYFFLALIFFIVEVLIALYIRDRFVRPYLGDYLVVILIYCAIRTFVNGRPWKIACGVLVFSYFIELLQYFNFVARIGLSNNVFAKTVLGYGFEWWDIFAYTLGVATIILVEYGNTKKDR